MPAEAKKIVHNLANRIQGILGAIECAGSAIDEKDWKKAKRMWKLALQECRVAVSLLTQLRTRVTMLRDEGLQTQSVAESVTDAMTEAGVKTAKVKR